MRPLLLPGLLVVLGAARRPPHPSPGSRLGASRLTAEVLELRECNASSSVRVANWTQRRAAGGNIVVDALFVVSRSADAIVKARVAATRCSEFGTHCERVVSVPVGPRVCAMWAARGMFWTPIRNSIEDERPPRRLFPCPPKEGHYRMRDAAMDLEQAARMCPYPLEHSVWTIVLEMWEAEARPALCLVIKSKVIRWKARPAGRP